MPTKTIVTGLGSSLSGRKIIQFEFGLGTDGKPGIVGLGDETLRLPLPMNCIFKRWTFNCVGAPAGADAVVDIFVSGTSIFNTTLPTKAVFPDGGFDLSSMTVKDLFTGINFYIIGGVKDALIYAKVLQVGSNPTPSTSPGVGFMVTLEFE
jgi:hypothetical protein